MRFMIKVVEIDCCSNCPHIFRSIDGSSRRCRVDDFKEIDVPTTTMPGWCPLPCRHLTQQCSGQETSVCNCIEWKDITAGWCPVHGTINSCH